MSLVLSVCLSMLAFAGPDHWPNWRGPEFSGAVPDSNPPTTWSETDNIRWKVDVPGFGLATPVIWGDHIFLLTAVKTDKEAEGAEKPEGRSWMKPIVAENYYSFDVIALDRATGKQAWQTSAVEKVPHETTHGDASWASISPVTDGEVLIASFGSAGIFGFDLEGNRLWQVDLGNMRTRNGFGEGSSPALYGDTVVVNWDHEEQSFIVALDKKTGKEKWRVMRDEPTSWSTPAIAKIDDRVQVIVNATNKIRGYDLADGSLIWSCEGMTLNTIPSPIVDGTIVYAGSGFRGNALLAIDIAGASGDLTGSDRILWSYDRDTPYVPSLLLYRDQLYFLKSNNGILTSFNAKSGETLFGPVRLPEVKNVYASPIGAGGHVYIIGRRGTSEVIKAGPKFEPVATNTLDDKFDASPVVVDDVLYLRGHKHLYAIAK